MHQVTSVELKRDCPAVQIPAGNGVTLKAGTPVDITQTLGGSYTVHANGGLFRIAAQDADDRIIYESDSGRVWYDSNGNAAGGNFLFADLDAGLALTNNDFVVV